jgi:uncharacterized membrane protein
MDEAPDPRAPDPMTEKVAGMEHRLREVAATLERIERAASQARRTPAWRRVTEGEHRLPVTSVIVAMIVLQLRVPTRFSLLGWWVLPLVEAALLVAVGVANPWRISTFSRRVRVLTLALIGVATVANGRAAAYLILGLVAGTEGRDAVGLLVVGGSIWLTNVVVFALWYWELDRGGPGARAQAMKPLPDFVFPQMSTPDLAGADWEPQFTDYLYLAFTNATAFSPTDTLPFSRWAKLAMGLQSAVSLTTGALVIARAVNILQ